MTSHVRCSITGATFPTTYRKILFFVELPKIPKLDLGFAISIGSSDADANLQKIKDTMKSIIDRYGKSDIRYSFILFGDEPFERVSFAESQRYTVATLKDRINRFTRISGAALDKTLEEAKEIFERTARPDAKEVLVVIMDQTQSSGRESTKRKAKELQISGVKVVPVVLGEEGNKVELEEITRHKNNLVEMEKDENEEKAAEKIMIKVLEGNLTCSKFVILRIQFNHVQI